MIGRPQMINQTVLSNQRSYADLTAKLLLSDVERERVLYLGWKDRVEAWRGIQSGLAVIRFR